MRLELRPGVAQRPPHATTVELTHAHGRASLVVTAEHGSATIGDRTWHDFGGDARLLAWALAYESLLMRLSDLFGTSLLPVALFDSPSPSSLEAWHWIEFRFQQDGKAGCDGVIGVDHALMESIAAAPGWQRGVDAGLHIERDAVPLPCRLSLPPAFLSAAVLRGLATGDVVIVGPRATVVAAMRLRVDTNERAINNAYAWIAAAVPGGISISRALTLAELRNDTTMSQDTPSKSSNPGEGASPDIRDSIRVRVELVVDTLEMTLSELDRLSAGQILSLGQPLDSATVSLRANGKTFASGELVSLGDLLGVKLTRIGENLGLQ